MFKTLTDVLHHSKESPNYFLWYYLGKLYKVGVGLSSTSELNKEIKADFEAILLPVTFTNPLIKMKWFYIK